MKKTDLEKLLKLQESRLHTLFEITIHPELSLADQFRAALKVGAESLSVKIGVLSHIVGEDYTILYIYDGTNHGPHEGDKFQLAQTYCDMTVKKNDVVAISKMSASPYKAKACFKIFKLESYIGVPIMVDGELFGTLAFLTPEPHDHPGFKGSDEDFVRIMGKWISSRLEHERVCKK